MSLLFELGPRLPAGLSEAWCVARPLPQYTHAGLHCYRDKPRAEGREGDSAAEANAIVQVELQSAQPDVRGT